MSLLLNSKKKTSQSVRAAIVNSWPLDSMLRVVTVVPQIMICSIRGEEDSDHYKNCIKSHENKMATRIHRSLRVVAFNANCIGRQRYELSKQLQDLHVDVALFSETHLIPHERFFIPNKHFYRTDCYPDRNGRTAVAVRKVIPHN
jgi:hypothetical protein